MFQTQEAKENVKKQQSAAKEGEPSVKKAKSSHAASEPGEKSSDRPLGSPAVSKEEVKTKKTAGDGQLSALPYEKLASVFEKIDATTKRLEIQKLLTEFFISVKSMCDANDCSLLVSAVYLAANKVAPDFKGIELGCGDSILAKAIEKVTGRTKKAISSKYEASGDLGLVAAEFKKTQRTLFGRKPQALTLARVHSGKQKCAV